MECRFVRGLPVGTPPGWPTCGGSAGTPIRPPWHAVLATPATPLTTLAWAREQGLEVSDRGRIPAEALPSYEAGH